MTFCDISGSLMIRRITDESFMSRLVTGKFRTLELNENFTSYET